MSYSPMAAEEENARTVYLVAAFSLGPYRGSLFEFKIQQGGEVMARREKGGLDEDEPPLLTSVASFFNNDPDLPASHIQCARFSSPSKLYLLLDAGTGLFPRFLPKTKPHSLDGITYDSKTKSWGSFRRPIEYKPHGHVISAYGKLYYLTDPGCFPHIPTPSFERYDPTNDSWECLPSFPFYNEDLGGMEIVGYAIFRGCIFLSLGFAGRYKFVAFHISTRQWLEVEAHDSYQGYVNYSIMGRAIVIGDTVYTVTGCYGQVITLSFKLESNRPGQDYFSVFPTVLSGGLETEPPPSPFRGIRSVSMLHLGNLEFCLVQTGFNYESDDRQHICITTFKIVVEEGTSILHIKTLHSMICDMYIPTAYWAFIKFSFTPDCEDVENEEEWEWSLKKSVDTPEEDEAMVIGMEECTVPRTHKAKQSLRRKAALKRRSSSPKKQKKT